MESNENNENSVNNALRQTSKINNDCCDHITEKPEFQASFIETNNRTLKYKCPMCSKKFKNKEKVRNHVNSHVTVHSIYNYKCSDCNCYLANREEFDVHKKIHKKIRGRPRKDSISNSDDASKLFICDKCAKCFKRKQQLLHHNLTHQDIRSFKCFECEKSFKLKQQLQNHLKIHVDLRPFICKTCSKSFKFKQQLENHHKTHTDIRLFKCILCNKAFKFKQQLQTHCRVHDGLRMFQCDSCSKAFKLKQQLQFHMKVHSNERPFQCNVCKKCFKLKQQLQIHLFKVHHKHENTILESNVNYCINNYINFGIKVPQTTHLVVGVNEEGENEDMDTSNEFNILEPNINLEINEPDQISENITTNDEDVNMNMKLCIENKTGTDKDDNTDVNETE